MVFIYLVPQSYNWCLETMFCLVSYARFKPFTESSPPSHAIIRKQKKGLVYLTSTSQLTSAKTIKLHSYFGLLAKSTSWKDCQFSWLSTSLFLFLQIKQTGCKSSVVIDLLLDVISQKYSLSLNTAWNTNAKLSVYMIPQYFALLFKSQPESSNKFL